MSDAEIPPEVCNFIRNYIHSIERLEIFLLVSGEKSQGWSAREIYETILSSERSVERGLDEFVQAGLVSKDSVSGKYSFLKDSEFSELATQLKQIHKLTPIRVIEEIYKVRPDPAQHFADAFKLKNKS